LLDRPSPAFRRVRNTYAHWASLSVFAVLAPLAPSAQVIGPILVQSLRGPSGAEQTANQAIRLARKGSVIVVVGVFGETPRVDLGLVQDREFQGVGTLMHQRSDYVAAIRALAEGGIVMQPLVTVSVPFRKYLDAYHFIQANTDRVMKVMIDLDR
jgi:threonine dehydrogenase-like Zn-dependent dehydrogenase